MITASVLKGLRVMTIQNYDYLLYINVLLIFKIYFQETIHSFSNKRKSLATYFHKHFLYTRKYDKVSIIIFGVYFQL